MQPVQPGWQGGRCCHRLHRRRATPPPPLHAYLATLLLLQAELAQVRGFQRVQRLAVYARIFAAEIFGTVLAVPFGLRALSLHRSLPDARQRQRAGSTVAILRDVRCGPRASPVCAAPACARAASHDGEPGCEARLVCAWCGRSSCYERLQSSTWAVCDMS